MQTDKHFLKPVVPVPQLQDSVSSVVIVCAILDLSAEIWRCIWRQTNESNLIFPMGMEHIHKTMGMFEIL